MANVSGTNAGETLNGTALDDIITGLGGNDTLNGLDGNDILNGGLGADTLNGGNGTDTATYASATAGVNVNLVSGTQPNTGEAAGDVYSSIENLVGSNFNDYLAGNGANNSIWGGGGDDTLWGYGGTINYLYGEGGVDTIVGSSGIDIMDGGAGTDLLRFNGDTVSYQLSNGPVTASLLDQSINTGDAAGDIYISMEDLTGTNFSDTLYGDNSALNNLLGLNGDDKLYGNGGTDIMIGGAGADRLDGGAGEDVADYETYRFEEFEHSGAPNGGIVGVTASLLNQSINTFDAVGDTYFSVENIAGSLLDDTLEGDNNRNVILAWAGADTVRGMGGDDTLEGMPGADFIDGGTGEDTASYNSAGTLVIPSWGFYTQVGVGVTASLLNPLINTNDAAGDTYANVENLLGSGFADTLQGDNLHNAIFGGAGNDTLKGEGGDDTLEGGAGGDTIDGDAGYDFASYADATSNVQISLDGSLPSFGDAAGDTFLNVEGVLGSSFGDVIYGDAKSNTLQGGAGADNLNGQGGDDLIVGGAGGDSMTGGSGNDTVSYESSTSGVVVSMQDGSINTGDAVGDIAVGFEFLHGSNFNDTLYSYQNVAITLRGLAGNDILYGGNADDILIGDAGGDQLNGGEGYDLASYVTATTGVVANLASSIANTGDAAGDSYNGIENLAGTNFNDTLTGDFRDNILHGLVGNDILNGGDGHDGLEGGDGNDTLNGEVGNDRLIGGLGDDIINGGDGDDVIFSDAGADKMDGGVGNDLLTYENSTQGVAFSMASGAAGTAGDALGDTYANIENVIGSAFNDSIGGSSANNRLLGGAGNDTLIGNGGEDHLEGGVGGDTLNGNGGYAYADYTTATSGVSAYLTWEAGGSGDAAGDHFVSIEGMVGSSFADILSGDSVDNTLQGGDGNDWLFGREGSDYLVGGNGTDVLSGGAGNDLLDGGAGNDVAYYRDAGATLFTVAQYGFKTGMVDGRNYGISLDIANGVNNFGEAAYDQLVNIENIWGSNYDDVIRGADDVGGQVYGFAGNDILDGRGGDDIFYGGTGSDTITGGAGVDDFFFLSYYDHVNSYGTSEPNEGGDTFTDFQHGVDHITVSRYWFGFGNIGGPAAALTSANADFLSQQGGATSTKPTFLWNDQTKALYFDDDGTGSHSATLLATLQAGATLTLSDIWTA